MSGPGAHYAQGNDPYDDEIDLGPHARALWREKGFLILLFLAALAVGVAVSYYGRTTVQYYEAETTLLLQKPDGSAAEPGQRTLELYRKMLEDPILKARVVRRVGLAATPYLLDGMTRVDPGPEPHLLRLRVRADDPALATQVLNAWVEVFLSDLRSLERQTVETAREALFREIRESLAAAQDLRRRLAALRASSGSVPAPLRAQAQETADSLEVVESRLSRLLATLEAQSNSYEIGL